MSRISLILLCVFAHVAPAMAQEAAGPADPMIKYQALTSVVVKRCVMPSGEREITVCGRRMADRWRVPFVGFAPGDPRGESVSGERVRLQHQTTPLQDHGPFLIGGGSVGVHVSTSIGGDGGLKLRPLAD